MSRAAADRVLAALGRKPDLLLCAATGHSPLGLYRLLAEEARQDPARFAAMRVLKLDEWGGVPPEDPQTCESYLRAELLGPLNISEDRYFSFASDPADPAAECARIQALIAAQGPIDLCVLGLGRNGHIAFNEPAEELQPHCHVAALSADSMQHSMAAQMARKPSYGLCIGVADILQSKEVLLLVAGAGKETAYQQLMQRRISTRLPASLLWLHPGASALVDAPALGLALPL